MALKVTSTDVKVVLSDASIAAITGLPGGEVYDYLVRAGKEIATEAVHHAPRRTGHLRRTIRSRVVRANAVSTRVQIRCTAEYAGYVHDGTGPIVSARPMVLYARPRSPQAAVATYGNFTEFIGHETHRVSGQAAQAFMTVALASWVLREGV